jgi:hypothetical protein
MMSWIRPLWLSLAVLAVAAAPVAAASTLSIWVGSGVTELTFEGVDIRIETTGDVVVYLSMEDGHVVGRVELATGSRSATVSITLLDDPDRVIFEGRIVVPYWFADYLPQETGRGEQ